MRVLHNVSFIALLASGCSDPTDGSLSGQGLYPGNPSGARWYSSEHVASGSQIFEMIDKNIYVAGCYNGSGIGVGTLFGEQIAIMASDQQSDEIEIINKRVKPNWLPPSPILNLGVQTRLFFERLRAKSEI